MYLRCARDNLVGFFVDVLLSVPWINDHEAVLPAYDAAYVALAVERDGTAYTADGTLLQDVEGSEYEDTVAHIQTY